MIFDAAVVGAGVMGCGVALHLARGGMQVALLDRGAVCGAASGANGGILGVRTMPPALIPYALRGQEMWLRLPAWCEGDVQAVACPGLSVAFTEAEAAALEQDAKLRRAAGAAVELVSGGRALEIEPGLAGQVLLACHGPEEGLVSARLAGRAFCRALPRAGVALFERRAVSGLERSAAEFTLRSAAGPLLARRIVLAGGAWLKEMAAWLGLRLPLRVLVRQQLATERQRPVLRTVLGVGAGLLSLAQQADGTVLIGGTWQAIGDTRRGGVAVHAESLRAHLRLAAQTVPALRQARLLHAWPGLEAGTADGLPALGPVPGVPEAWIIGGAPSGLALGPCLGKLLAQAMLGEAPELPLFPVARLLAA